MPRTGIYGKLPAQAPAKVLSDLKQAQLHPASPNNVSFISGMPAVWKAIKRSAHRTVMEAY